MKVNKRLVVTLPVNWLLVLKTQLGGGGGTSDMA